TPMHRLTTVAGLLALVALLIPPSRASAAPCRRVCKPAIQRCVGAGGRWRRCRRQLIQLCKQAGQVACDEYVAPTTTSTTTTPPLPTTSSTTTTLPRSCADGVCLQVVESST